MPAALMTIVCLEKLMIILNISYKKPDLGIIQHHYAVFLTRTNEVLFCGPFLNNNEAMKIARDVLFC